MFTICTGVYISIVQPPKLIAGNDGWSDLSAKYIGPREHESQIEPFYHVRWQVYVIMTCITKQPLEKEQALVAQHVFLLWDIPSFRAFSSALNLS